MEQKDQAVNPEEQASGSFNMVRWIHFVGSSCFSVFSKTGFSFKKFKLYPSFSVENVCHLNVQSLLLVQVALRTNITKHLSSQVPLISHLPTLQAICLNVQHAPGLTTSTRDTERKDNLCLKKFTIQREDKQEQPLDAEGHTNKSYLLTRNLSAVLWAYM